MHLFQMLPNKS